MWDWSDEEDEDDVDMLTIVTKNGKFAGVWIPDDEIYKKAELVREMMVEIMEEPEAAEGTWAWQIDIDARAISGYCFDE